MEVILIFPYNVCFQVQSSKVKDAQEFTPASSFLQENLPEGQHEVLLRELISFKRKFGYKNRILHLCEVLCSYHELSAY
jgi:hypothetical protein